MVDHHAITTVLLPKLAPLIPSAPSHLPPEGFTKKKKRQLDVAEVEEVMMFRGNSDAPLDWMLG